MKTTFCNYICKKSERKFKCVDCNTFVCSNCSINKGKEVYCIDCYVSFHLPYSDLVVDYITDKKPMLC